MFPKIIHFCLKGIIIYFTYGIRNSAQRADNERQVNIFPFIERTNKVNAFDSEKK